MIHEILSPPQIEAMPFIELTFGFVKINEMDNFLTKLDRRRGRKVIEGVWESHTCLGN